jgi:hypothetical protein
MKGRSATSFLGDFRTAHALSVLRAITPAPNFLETQLATGRLARSVRHYGMHDGTALLQ